MRKHIFTIVLLSMAASLVAQQYHTPKVCRNFLDEIQYQCANPEILPAFLLCNQRAVNEYTHQLDSVIGSDDFDMTCWKNVYFYGEQGKTEIHFLLQDAEWQPVLMTKWVSDETQDTAFVSRWNGEDWEDYQRACYQYLTSGTEKLLQEMTVEEFVDTAWVGKNRSTYEYDEQQHLVLNVNYSGMNSHGEWNGSSKTASTYHENGLLAKRLLSTYRNGSWRESSKDTLVYDENQRCLYLLTQRKFGYGPGTNIWRDASKYEFTYADDGSVASETLYSAGWFGTDMTLDSKAEYEFDSQGNLARKTVNIFNGANWVVRDLYENRFDHSIASSAIMGLSPVWESTVGKGLGYVIDPAMPLYSQWLSCSIVSTALDTQFDLYYSAMAAVEEQTTDQMKAYSFQGQLVVENDVAADIVVYDLNGRVVASQAQTLKSVFRLTPGLYLVRRGNTVVKTIVRP